MVARARGFPPFPKGRERMGHPLFFFRRRDMTNTVSGFEFQVSREKQPRIHTDHTDATKGIQANCGLPKYVVRISTGDW
jgi:hypothetical protein